MQIQPYLFFEGRCEEALEFYQQAVGAQVVSVMRVSDMPGNASCAPTADGNKILHMSFRVGETLVMASDGRCSGHQDFQGFALSLSVTDESKAGRYFDALSEGGQVQMPRGKTFFSPSFGMVRDRFGVLWMVIVLPQEAAALDEHLQTAGR